MVLWILLTTSVLDLSNFFNKSALNIPSNHFLLKYRIFIIGFFSIIVNTDFYNLSRSSGKKRTITTSLKVFHFIVFGEIILFLKNYDPEIFKNATPVYVKVFWGIISVVLFLFFLYACMNGRKKYKK